MSRSRFTPLESLSVEQRREMIAIAAYYLAESRGFAPGGADDDWFAAEQVIDAMLAETTEADCAQECSIERRVRNALKLSEGAGRGASH